MVKPSVSGFPRRAEFRDHKIGFGLFADIKEFVQITFLMHIQLPRIQIEILKPAFVRVFNIEVKKSGGKALSYGLHHREAFVKYLDDGRFEIDNNLVENAVRPVKLGAKNWLFFGSEHAGYNAAVIYTLVENCRRHGIPVEEYLCGLLTRLPGESDPEIIASLTPARKAATRSEKSAAA